MNAQVVLLGNTLAARDEAFQRMDDSVRLCDEYIDKKLDKHQERLARHQHNLEVLRGRFNLLEEKAIALEEENILLKTQVESMSNQLCRCGEGQSVLTGQGSQDEPFELDYIGSPRSYHTPPSAPAENTTPILILTHTPSENLPNSNQVNMIQLCCMIPTACIHDKVAEDLEVTIAVPSWITTCGDQVAH